ncbi:hypothetical protein [Methylocapsa sp. S129]|uniref:hypothetical protein n=1 Tax=Methylocapsa sp. S129 TaxID=1641869 RepID=UPI00131CA4CE|nr:hypothetical protein [Methylocapsa sp. S129]
MSVAFVRPSQAYAARAGSPLHSVAFLTAVGLIFTLAISWRDAAEVWRTGAFANTDDAMRLVEVRDWLAGQAWFDLHQYRLDPPDGEPMHWTRVLDLPLGLLIRIFSVFLPVESAERLTRIVFPLALHGALFAAIACLARRLAGPAAMLPAVMIAALTGGVLVQFQPGRIHHHSAQILLAVLILWATIGAIDARKFWPAAGAAALAALSLSINIENLTYILVEIAAFALVFVAQGERFRAALLGFGLSLAASSLIVFIATVGPSRYFVGACDAFSTAHLVAIFFGAAAFSILAALSHRLTSAPLRLAGCALGGAVVLGVMALAYPACLHDPQAGVDPLLRKLWLEHVEEARPLFSLVVAHPVKFVTLALATLLGFAGALAAAWREEGATRVNWLVVCAFIAIGLATSLWQVRALSSASAVAIFGGAWVVARTADWAARRSGALAKLAPFALGLPFCSVFWAAVAPAQAQSNAVEGRTICRAPAAIEALGALPTSLLMAPIDMGSDILANSHHSVLAAPYHRDNHGNREMVDAMMAEPEAARQIVRNSGAAYVVFCPAMPELEIYAAASPDGLAAALLSGKSPDWLVPEPIAGSPYRIYKVR